MNNDLMDAMYTIETIAEPPCETDGALAVVPVALPGDHSFGTDGYQFREPILTIGGAAQMLGVSQKRLANIIAEEKLRIGHPPDFVCDAGGKMRMRILRDELLEWMRAKREKRGRPSKLAPR